MIIIGGITRLTQSGLSMVKWEPIMGTIPPLSEQEWMDSFNAYKQSPEFHHYNNDFELSDYKKIFFWEYLHRLLARLIGLVFIIPCVYFWAKGHFSNWMKKAVLTILILGVFQGVLGWFMVKSGLKDIPHVSHYRLAAHLLTALGLMIYIYWIALRIKYQLTPSNGRLRRLTLAFLILLIIQIIYGAFVAGLKAGLMYNTFPCFGDYWWPPELNLTLAREGGISFIRDGAWVQLIHRGIALILIGAYIFLMYKARKWKVNTETKRSLRGVGIVLLLQITIGITTLILAVPITMGVLHQGVAIILLVATVHAMFVLQADQEQP